MFTGIIKEIGSVTDIQKNPNSLMLEINAPRTSRFLNVGSSVAVNGVCLTVVKKIKTRFIAQVMPETACITTLESIRTEDRVNLEPSLRVGDELGGHFVLGHIDGVGVIADIKTNKDILFTVNAPKQLMQYIVRKGSITVDGVSLTVVSKTKNSFSVALIEHTFKMTTLGLHKKEDKVNLEVDVLARYSSL